MEDISRYIVNLLEQGDHQIQELEDFVLDAAQDLKRSQEKLLHHQKYYHNIFSLYQSPLPSADDYAYDYLISLFTDNPKPKPQSFDKYHLDTPPTYWLRERWSVPFIELPRQEQVRLIREYTSEQRQETLDWNLKQQSKSLKEIQKHRAILDKWKTKLLQLRSARKRAAEQFMSQ